MTLDPEMLARVKNDLTRAVNSGATFCTPWCADVRQLLAAIESLEAELADAKEEFSELRWRMDGLEK